MSQSPRPGDAKPRTATAVRLSSGGDLGHWPDRGMWLVFRLEFVVDDEHGGRVPNVVDRRARRFSAKRLRLQLYAVPAAVGEGTDSEDRPDGDRDERRGRRLHHLRRTTTAERRWKRGRPGAQG